MMSNSNVQRLLDEIEAQRTLLHEFVDTKLDAMKESVMSGKPISEADVVLKYPLSSPPHIFKGTKPLAVIFDSECIELNSWRKVYTEVLCRCATEKHDALMSLRGKIAGRSRTFLAAAPGGMDFPVKLADDLFAEADFDTEQLIITLTKRIADVVRFDYSRISIVVKSKL